MNTALAHSPGWDPYDYDLLCDPHGAFAAIREGHPVYYNAEHDFYALSRYEDCIWGLSDRDIFKNARGVMLEQIRSGKPMPRGLFNFEDPPEHTIHRALLSRVFTPNRMARLEPQIREFCARSLEPLVGRGGFDFVRDLSALVPMRVIGMLLGIPEGDQDAIRRRGDTRLRTEQGKPMDYDQQSLREGFDAHIDWRIANPSDDIMSQLIHAEFEDETGATRRLTREELGNMIGFLASAGNETTNRLIGWAGKLLSDHPDQRRDIGANRALIPQAVEEVLRFEPPAHQVGRHVAKDFMIHGQVIPAGSVVIFLTGAANRDPREFPDPDRFDIHREPQPNLGFGFGLHNCLGLALAKLEAEVALRGFLAAVPDYRIVAPYGYSPVPARGPSPVVIAL